MNFLVLLSYQTDESLWKSPTYFVGTIEMKSHRKFENFWLLFVGVALEIFIESSVNENENNNSHKIGKCTFFSKVQKQTPSV